MDGQTKGADGNGGSGLKVLTMLSEGEFEVMGLFWSPITSTRGISYARF